MKLAFARQQPFSEKALCHLETAALCEVAAMSNENIAYVVGMIYEIDMLGSKLEVPNVTTGGFAVAAVVAGDVPGATAGVVGPKEIA